MHWATPSAVWRLLLLCIVFVHSFMVLLTCVHLVGCTVQVLTYSQLAFQAVMTRYIHLVVYQLPPCLTFILLSQHTNCMCLNVCKCMYLPEGEKICGYINFAVPCKTAKFIYTKFWFTSTIYSFWHRRLSPIVASHTSLYTWYPLREEGNVNS